MSLFAGKTAMVTGASAGLGEQFALQLADLGVTHLLITARRADRLEQLKTKLLAVHPAVQVDTRTADLGNENAVTQLMSDLDAAGFSPDILINNAGFGDLGVFETSEPVKIELMLAVNVVALTRLSRWIVPALLKKESGWICNVGSTAGMLPLPTFAVYAATKAYVNSFTEALRVELHGSGVSVIALCPGPVETEFGQVATRANGKRAFSAPALLSEPKADVVKETLEAMAWGQGRIIPGIIVRIPILLAESTPRWILRLFFSAMSGQFRRERAAAKS